MAAGRCVRSLRILCCPGFCPPVSTAHTCTLLPRPFPTTQPPAMSFAGTALRSLSTVNFYSGSQLNRLSWLRNDDAFLNRAIQSPQATFILLNKSRPLVHAQGEHKGRLATLTWGQVASAITPYGEGVFGPEANNFTTPQGQDEQKALAKATRGLVPDGLALVLLGILESDGTALPGREPSGTPYFGLSLSFVPSGVQPEATRVALLCAQLEQDDQYYFADTRAIAMLGTWPTSEAAMVAQATSLLDWNERNQFCPACARRQYSFWAGYKRGCASVLEGASAPLVRTLTETGGHRTPCPSTQSVHNFSYPRTDPVTIMAVISPDGEHILLGRKKTAPAGYYSCLAGFVEPGESVEDAVRREVLEEAGVQLGAVYYHSSQPWPFPANLMIGAYGQALPNHDTIRLDLDNELEDARFFSRQEILAILDQKDAAEHMFTKHELTQMDNEASRTPTQPKVSIRFPRATAIAHTLIASWAHNQALLPPAPARRKT